MYCLSHGQIIGKITLVEAHVTNCSVRYATAKGRTSSTAVHLRQGNKPVSLFIHPSGQNVNKNVFE